VKPPGPSDYELLRAVYRRLDKEGLLADHPGLTRRAVDEFFRRVARAMGLEHAKERRGPRSLVLYTDGGSWGNPGPAGFGVVLKDPRGGVVAEDSGFIGRATSNQAEYRGLARGLELAREHGAQDLLVRSDSQLLVSQLTGRYRVKSRKLLPLFLEVRRLLEGFRSWRAEYVPREANAEADLLARKAIERHRDEAP